MYGEQRFNEAAERWGRAALQPRAPSLAHLWDMLIDGRQNVPRDVGRAFELDAAAVAVESAQTKQQMDSKPHKVLVSCSDEKRGELLEFFKQNALRLSHHRFHIVGSYLHRQISELLAPFKPAPPMCIESLLDIVPSIKNGTVDAWIFFLQSRAVSLVLSEALNLATCGPMIVAFNPVSASVFLCTPDAAEMRFQGHAGAQFNLGSMYAKGLGVAKDDAEALRLYRLAADQGHADAQFNLGVIYAEGQGVAQDDAEAVQLYRLAADQGHARAQYNLGVMYAEGQGVAQDDAEAVQLYRLAADQGHAGAQFNLGNMFKNGKGVARDRVEAIR
jgi:hypothetical protein